MVVGTISAIIMGCCFPMNLFIYGKVIEDFIDYQVDVGKATAMLNM
jgi:hypothetical protein